MHLGQKISMLFSTPGWSFFPRRALRETLRIPRSPSLAIPSFLRAGPLGPGTLPCGAYARSLTRLIPPFVKMGRLAFQSLEHVFGLRGWDKPYRDWLLSS